MDYRYVIVGSGMAADAAAKAVRKADPAGNVLLVGAEPDEPYRRPPLSKGLWNGDEVSKIALATARHGVDLTLADEAVAVDLEARTVTLASGKAVTYARLLIATGATARSLPQLPVGGPVVAYRSLGDYRDVKTRAGPGRRVLVVGGGFIGSELAAGLSRAGAEVHMAFQEDAISSLRFPAELAKLVTDDYRARGVRVRSGTSVAEARIDPEGVDITFTDGTAQRFDLVVVGIGARPNTDLAESAGLAVDNGILVDEHLRARRAGAVGGDGAGNDLGVYAAGDVASFPWPPPFHRGRIEHEDNAVSMGSHAGREMAASYLASQSGGGEVATGPGESPYTHFPFFYSDLFDNGYEAVGALDSRLDTVVDWHKPGSEAVVYYLEGDLLKGILLWNTWGQVDNARDLILAAEPVDRTLLEGRLPA